MIAEGLLKPLNGEKEPVGVEVTHCAFVNPFEIPAGERENGVIAPVQSSDESKAGFVTFRNERVGSSRVFTEVTFEDTPIDISVQGVVSLSGYFKSERVNLEEFMIDIKP